MWMAFLQDTFHRFSGFGTGSGSTHAGRMDDALLDKTVQRVVDETYGRLRILPGYEQRLRGPVSEAFRYIDRLVEGLPPAINCCRSAYVSDPRVNAFFAGPDQIREIFSRSEEVRSLFDANLETDECWALLCMSKHERRQFGMALVNDDVRKDVLQTGVSFTDHQLVAPGITEMEARQGLKCCIFNSLLSYIRRRAKTAKENREGLENRRRSLKSRLRHETDEDRASDMKARIAELERDLAGEELSLITLDDHLEFIALVLGNPSQYVSRTGETMHINRLGIKQDQGSIDAGNVITLAEIHVACHEPRIAALARFPRKELLPQHDYLKKADLFLTV